MSTPEEPVDILDEKKFKHMVDIAMQHLPNGVIVSGLLAVALYYGLYFYPNDIDVLINVDAKDQNPVDVKSLPGREDSFYSHEQKSYMTIPHLLSITTYSTPLEFPNFQYLRISTTEEKFVDAFDLDICKVLMRIEDNSYTLEHLTDKKQDDREIRFDVNKDPLRGRQTLHELARLFVRLAKYKRRGFYLKRGDLVRILQIYAV